LTLTIAKVLGNLYHQKKKIKKRKEKKRKEEKRKEKARVTCGPLIHFVRAIFVATHP
jgi:hypothetical protein